MKPECDRIHSMHHMTVITITYIPKLLGPAFLLRVILEVILPHFVTIRKDSLVLVACIQNFICVTPVGHFGSLHWTWRLYYWYQSLMLISLLPWWFLLEGQATSLWQYQRLLVLSQPQTVLSQIVYRQLKSHWNCSSQKWVRLVFRPSSLAFYSLAFYSIMREGGRVVPSMYCQCKPKSRKWKWTRQKVHQLARLVENCLMHWFGEVGWPMDWTWPPKELWLVETKNGWLE